MTDFHRLTKYLHEILGSDRLAILADPNNTEDIKAFCDRIILNKLLPRTMTLGDRTYNILSILKQGETHIHGKLMISRAKEMFAHQGQDEGQYVLDHQDQIPEDLRKLFFVFTNWRYIDHKGFISCIYEDNGQMKRHGAWIDRGGWGNLDCVLQRIS